MLATLSGCATAAKPDEMVPEKITPVHKSSGDVSIAVSGGKETSSMGASQVSNDAFAQALSASIEQSGLFAKVSPAGTRYRLTAFIGKVDQPMFGFSLKVTMEVSYTLIDTQSGTTIWTKDIPSEYTAKGSEAFAATKRLRLANEGEAKNNISKALTEISALNLP
ncbi:MAG: hypothetical protein ACRETH_02955 [Steroidobacteraceae bacterium]